MYLAGLCQHEQIFQLVSPCQQLPPRPHLRARLASQKLPVDLIASLAFLQKTQTIHIRLKCVVYAIQPLSIVEKGTISWHIKHSSISVDTLMSSLAKLTAHVKNKVTELLPGHFAVFFDGWSCSDAQYVAVYASFPTNHQMGLDSLLLAIAPMEDKDSLKADNFFHISNPCCRSTISRGPTFLPPLAATKIITWRLQGISDRL